MCVCMRHYSACILVQLPKLRTAGKAFPTAKLPGGGGGCHLEGEKIDVDKLGALPPTKYFHQF